MDTALTELKNIITDLHALGDPQRAHLLQRFFKTGPGQYGEGDVFLGLTVPQTRTLIKKYQNISLELLDKLIQQPYHEARLLALLILIKQYEAAKSTRSKRATTPKNAHKSITQNKTNPTTTDQTKQIFNFYLSHTECINNWDLVDLTAPRIVGPYLNPDNPQDLKQLIKLADSNDLWEKRISILSTFHYTCHGNPAPTLLIAEKLIYDKHDLIQKAVGWMLREVGKRCDHAIEELFLNKYAATMPRTALRYAIERFTPSKKQHYLGMKNANYNL